MTRVGKAVRGISEQRCRQHMPRHGLCTAPVDHVCDACGKLVCMTHIRLARTDPDAPRGRRWVHDRLPPEICITCCVLEAARGTDRVEDIEDAAREEFYASDTAVGLLGPDERAWLEWRGISMGPDGRPILGSRRGSSR